MSDTHNATLPTLAEHIRELRACLIDALAAATIDDLDVGRYRAALVPSMRAAVVREKAAARKELEAKVARLEAALKRSDALAAELGRDNDPSHE